MAVKGSITVRIISEAEGLVIIKGVRAVRVHSDKYVLLIMDDYIPTIGEIHGNVSILTDDGERIINDIDGFFKHQKNEFTLFVR